MCRGAGASSAPERAMHCGVEPDGQLLIQNRTPARPHVFGGLEQWIRLTPGQPYDVKIRYKCDSEANQLALGLKWQTRLKLPASPEWKEMVFRITAPLETRPDGTIRSSSSVTMFRRKRCLTPSPSNRSARRSSRLPTGRISGCTECRGSKGISTNCNRSPGDCPCFRCPAARRRSPPAGCRTPGRSRPVSPWERSAWTVVLRGGQG